MKLTEIKVLGEWYPVSSIFFDKELNENMYTIHRSDYGYIDIREMDVQEKSYTSVPVEDGSLADILSCVTFDVRHLKLWKILKCFTKNLKKN